MVAVVAGLGVYLQQARQAASALALDVEANLWLQRSAAALALGQPDRALAQAAQAYAVLPSEKTRSAVWQAGVAMAPALAFSFPAVARDGTPARATTVGAVSALAWEASMEGLLVGDRAGTLQGLRFTPAPALTALAAERRGPASKDRPEAVLALQRLADGSLLAVLEDGRILRQRSAGAPFDLAGQVDALAAAAVSETGAGLLVLTQSARQAHWVRCAPGGGCRLQEALSGLGAVTTIALEARSGQLAVADESGRLLVGSSAEPAALRPVRVDWPAATRVHALALRADGQRLAVAGSTGEVVVLDADDRELARLSTQGAAVQRLAWSPDGRLLAGDCEVESLCVWRSAADGSLSLATVLAVRGGGAGALAWSGDARRLAAGDLGGRLHVWDLAAAPGRAAVLRAAGVGPLADIDVHADGRRIVAADVRGRADGEEHLRAVGGEDEAAGGMAAGRDVGDDGLGGALRLHVAVRVGVADDAPLARHIDPFRLRPRRVEGDAEGIVEVGGEDARRRRGLGALGGTEDADLVAGALGDEDVAVRRHHDGARAGEAFGEERDLEAFRNGRHAVAALDEAGGVARGRGGERLGQVFRTDEPPDAGGVLLPAAEGRIAGEDLLGDDGRGRGHRRHEDQCQPMDHRPLLCLTSSGSTITS